MWYNYRSEHIFNKFSVAYLNAVKRVANLAPWHSNHVACDLTDLPIFIHHINSKLISYLFSIIHSNSKCLAPLKMYFRYSSNILINAEKIFKRKYCVSNILGNDLDALKSRINFIQNNEPRSNYMIL